MVRLSVQSPADTEQHLALLDHTEPVESAEVPEEEQVDQCSV